MGVEPEVATSFDAINKFLDVMEWESNADRTNAVAAALTVVLRNHFPGGKPIFCVTANKSHAGKDTVIAFATGDAGSVSVSYQQTNWALERSVVGALKTNPDTAVVVVENARLDRRERFIASAFLERIATDPEPFLFSTGTGAPVRRKNDLVLAISTNFGTFSEDGMNRNLPSRLNSVGDVARRQSPIGNPRHEYLPANKRQIAAELAGHGGEVEGGGEAARRGCPTPVQPVGQGDRRHPQGERIRRFPRQLLHAKDVRTTPFGKPLGCSEPTNFHGRTIDAKANGSALANGPNSSVLSGLSVHSSRSATARTVTAKRGPWASS